MVQGILVIVMKLHVGLKVQQDVARAEDGPLVELESVASFDALLKQEGVLVIDFHA